MSKGEKQDRMEAYKEQGMIALIVDLNDKLDRLEEDINHEEKGVIVEDGEQLVRNNI